jgi:uncharacterized protein
MSIRDTTGKTLGKSILKDVRRHHEKVLDSVKKNIGDIIANEDIITGDRKKKVRVTVQALKDYYFRFAPPGKGVGEGGRDGKPQPGDGSGKPRAGDESGDAFFDAEFELEELIQLALEDCGLPNLRQREAQELEVPKGYRLKSIEKSGIWSLYDKRRTAKEAIRRITDYIIFLMRNTGCTQEEAETALILNKGNVQKAYELLLKYRRGEATLPKVGGGKFFLSGEDYRFFELEEEIEKVSNAAVFLLRDWSFSMDPHKYLVRMAFFWLSESIRRMYNQSRLVFIGYESKAERVSEEVFFKRSTSGGTIAHKAYKLTQQLIETEFPLNLWDIYLYHFSDGEDFAINEAGKRLEDLLKMGINFAGYGEIRDPQSPELLMGTGIQPAYPTLMTELINRFSLQIIMGDGNKLYHSQKYPFRGMAFRDKRHLHTLVKAFLPKELKEVAQ